MLIYLGLFFLIPDKFRNKLLSRQYLPITIVVGILGACLGLYGIYTTLYRLENYQVIGDVCGETKTSCGADGTDVNNTYCFINQKKTTHLEKGNTIEKIIPFNMSGRYIRVRPSPTVMELSQIIVFDKNGSNIGKNKNVTTNSTGTNTDLAKLVDGFLSPRESGWISDRATGTYVQIDLGSVQEIGNIKIIALKTDELRVSVLQTTSEEETTGKCIAPPALNYPSDWNIFPAEKEIIGPLMTMGYDGKKALDIYRGIKDSSTRYKSFTEYGLSDSQAAAAYNRLYSENLSKQRAGWEIFANWETSSNIITVSSDSILPLTNMTVKSADGIPTGAKITAVSGNTVRLDKATTTVGLNKPVKLNGNLDDTSYYAEIEKIKPLLTMALINDPVKGYNTYQTLSTFMSYNKSVTVTYTLDSSGNPAVDDNGNAILTKTSDNGEKAALQIIIGVTKTGAKDPNAIKSGDTVAVSPQEEKGTNKVKGYNITAPPNTTNWSTDAMSRFQLQTPALNIDKSENRGVLISDISNAPISYSINPPNVVDRGIMDAAASNTMDSANYKAPNQNESGVASTSASAEKEVFWLGWGMAFPYNSKNIAHKACIDAGADGLATRQQLVTAQTKGAQWCARGWLEDGTKAYPMAEAKSECGGKVGIIDATDSTAGATCYGYKPSDNDGIIGKLSTQDLIQTIDVNKTARYVRVRPSITSGDGYLHFSQIVVKDSSGKVISKEKPTYATSSYGSSKASSAVDGNETSRTWISGNVWHSGKPIVFNSRDPQKPNLDNEYWELDLGSQLPIGTITYYGRSDGNFERIIGVRFEVSNSPRPRPFSSISTPPSWNDKSYLNSSTLKCIPIKDKDGNEIETVKKDCNGTIRCIEKNQRDCTEGCTPGSSKNSVTGKCEEGAATLLEPAEWDTTEYNQKRFSNFLVDSNGYPIKREKGGEIDTPVSQEYIDTTLNEMKVLCANNPACSGITQILKKVVYSNVYSNQGSSYFREYHAIYLGAGDLVNVTPQSWSGSMRSVRWTGNETIKSIKIMETANTNDDKTPRNMCFKSAKDYIDDKNNYKGLYRDCVDSSTARWNLFCSPSQYLVRGKLPSFTVVGDKREMNLYGVPDSSPNNTAFLGVHPIPCHNGELLLVRYYPYDPFSKFYSGLTWADLAYNGKKIESEKAYRKIIKDKIDEGGMPNALDYLYRGASSLKDMLDTCELEGPGLFIKMGGDMVRTYCNGIVSNYFTANSLDSQLDNLNKLKGIESSTLWA